MLGHKAPCGTGDFDVIIDEDKYMDIMKNVIIQKNEITPILENQTDENIFIDINIPEVDNINTSCFTRFSEI